MADTERAVPVLRAHAIPLPDPDEPDFAASLDSLGAARVVLLGEATHGTAEFYRARAAITRHLIERHGFTAVAIEGDWPDAAQVDAFVRGRTFDAAAGPAFARFPTWMWRNQEVAAFVGWLRRWNEQAAAPGREVGFHGLDLYSMGASIEAVLRYLDEADPAAAREARANYRCLTPWMRNPAGYGRAALSPGFATCEAKALAALRTLLERRLELVGRDGTAFFDAAQNARLVANAERYYRAMYRGSRESWNLRDRHMSETLQLVLEAKPGTRAVVWAHNSHIGDARATEMGRSGELNLGQLCREALGEGARLVASAPTGARWRPPTTGTSRCGSSACARRCRAAWNVPATTPACPASTCRSPGPTRSAMRCGGTCSSAPSGWSTGRRRSAGATTSPRPSGTSSTTTCGSTTPGRWPPCPAPRQPGRTTPSRSGSRRRRSAPAHAA
jgi:erythromycin esterase-like protein